MKKMKLIYFMCIMLLAPLMAGVVADAETPCINDMAGYFSEEEVDSLTEQFERVKLDYNIDVIFVSENDLPKSNIDSSAAYIYESYGYGLNDEKDGIMLYICRGTREYSIYTNGRAYDIVTGHRLDKLENEVVEYLGEDRYYEACVSFVSKTDSYFANPNGGKIIRLLACAGIALVAGLVVAVILTLIKVSQMKTVAKQKTANNYITGEGANITNSQDIYLYSHVTKIPKPKQNSGGGGSSGRSGSRSGKF